MPNKLIAELNDSAVTADTILSAGDLPVEDLNIDFEPLDIPEAKLEELRETGTPVVALPAKEQGGSTPPGATPPLSGSGGTLRTTIRIPALLLADYRAMAEKLGIGYQTLIIRTLRQAAPRR